MVMTVVLGPPGAGKSTWVQEHAKPGDAIVDFDLIAQACGATEAHDAPPTVGSIVFAGRTAMLARAIESVTGEKDPFDGDVWVPMPMLAQDSIDEWAAKGVQFVLVDPGIEETKRQAQAEGRSASVLEAIDEWYENPPRLPQKGDRMLRIKSAPIEGEREGVFVGYASVFGNVDSYGDVVVKGAFAKSLEKFGQAGDGIPVLWGHRMDDPMMNIGSTVKAYEDDHGLRVEVQLDLANPTAVQVNRLIQQGRVKQMSFAYDVLDAAEGERDGSTVFELRELDIHEVSVVHVGANRLTELAAVKAAPETPAAPAVEEPAEREPRFSLAMIAAAERGAWH